MGAGREPAAGPNKTTEDERNGANSEQHPEFGRSPKRKRKEAASGLNNSPVSRTEDTPPGTATSVPPILQGSEGRGEAVRGYLQRRSGSCTSGRRDGAELRDG